MSENPLNKSDPISPRKAGGELCGACLVSFVLFATTAMFAALFVIT